METNHRKCTQRKTGVKPVWYRQIGPFLCLNRFVYTIPKLYNKLKRHTRTHTPRTTPAKVKKGWMVADREIGDN